MKRTRHRFDPDVTYWLLRAALEKRYPGIRLEGLIERVDGYILADDKKWNGVWLTVYSMSGFPNLTILLDFNHVPDAELQLAKMGYSHIRVVRYDGGTKRKAVCYAEKLARMLSLAYVIADSDMTSKMLVKIVNPDTGKLKFGMPTSLEKGTLYGFGKHVGEPRKVARPSWSQKQGIPGPKDIDATPEIFYKITLLAANVARSLDYYGFTFPHQSRAHDGFNGWNRHTMLEEGMSQGNFRGWFSDAPGLYANVPDLVWAVDKEDTGRTWQALRPSKSPVINIMPVAINFHVDKVRQSTPQHREVVYQQQEEFKSKGFDTHVYTTRETSAFSIRMGHRPVTL